MKIALLIVAVVFVATLGVGCGGDEGTAEQTTVAETTQQDRPSGPQLVTMTFDGGVGPANVGLLMADARGFFEDVGLEFSAGVPMWPRRAVTYVAKETDELGITQLPQLVLAKEKGAPIIAVGSLVSHPTTSLIWLPTSGIESIADLKGKTIGVPGVPFQEDLLGVVLKRAGLTLDDVKVKNLAYQLVPFLLKGRVDAIFGGSWNIDGATLEANGLNPVIKRVEDLGVPGYDELMVIARTDLVAKDPQMIRKFMSAALRGGAVAVREPAGAAKVIVEHPESREVGVKETRAGLESTLPLLSRSGHMDLRQARRMVNWMYREGLTQQKLPVSELLTNRYLPARP